jgi:predicted RNase H-like HicB family nuclease
VSVSDLTVRIEQGEDGLYWAEVDQLPGCFASGASPAELFEAIEEAVSIYLSSPTSGAVSAKLTGAKFTVLQPA